MIDCQEMEKSEDEFNDEDKKIMEQDAKAKNILYCAINPDDLKRISNCQTAKEMWEELDKEVATHDVNSTPPSIFFAREVTTRDVNFTPPSIFFDREVTTHDVNSIPLVSQQIPTSPLFNTPNLEFVDGTSDDPNKKFLNLCVSIHKHALNGNWAAAKRILDKEDKLKNAAITDGGMHTLLHIAAGANQIDFVKELLKMLDDNDIALQDVYGNTAFCYAAIGGNMEIVDLMLERNSQLPVIRGAYGYTPIHYAALQGRCKMTWHLYDKTIHCFQDKDLRSLFFASIFSGFYALALKMVRDRNELAFARDHVKEETALHILAHNLMPLGSSCHCPEHDHKPIMTNPGMNNHVVFQLVKYLWTTILEKHHSSNLELSKIINEPYTPTFVAAKFGNFGFLSELISVYPSLIWYADSNYQTIIHFAVLYRHASIFNLIHQIGHAKGVIVRFQNEYNRNNLLHLAAKLAPRRQLELVSGAAFQMCIELLWFETVKKVMLPWQINMRNKEGLTAQELFSIEHKELKENAESWMKKTAESCMLISTVIATGVFAAATTLPGGTDDGGKPNYLNKTPFLVFAISDASAFISSSTALYIFLSILVSRYGEYDFYKSLPLKLIFGLITLFISITSMMVALSTSFFITYYHGSIWVPSFISILSFLPILLYIGLQFSLFSDIFHSAYYWRTLSKPGKNMIYVLEK